MYEKESVACELNKQERCKCEREKEGREGIPMNSQLLPIVSVFLLRIASQRPFLALSHCA